MSFGTKIQLIFGTIMIALFVPYLVINTIYEETLGKQRLVIRVHSLEFGALFTDNGNFAFLPSRGLAARGHWQFWRGVGADLKPMLTIGCSYEIEAINSLFDDHALGVNRMPPQTTVVKVIRRIEPNKQECDISRLSGKSVCRDDQVIYIAGKGVFPGGSDCDFESFDAVGLVERKRGQN